MSDNWEKDSNYILLQIFRQLGKEDDTMMYLYDVEKHFAYFNAATAKLFDIPETVQDMPESILKRDFMLPESQEEFIRLHHLIEDEALEAVGTLKLKNAKGINTIYEIRLTRITGENGEKTAACVGRVKDVTERYVRDLSNKNHNKVLNGSKKFPFVYNKKRDVFKFTYTGSDLKTKEKNFFFYSRLIKEEKVCAKNDIGVFLDFINNGTEQPIQIELFDQVSEEYRWYVISGQPNPDNQDEVKGVFEDITDLKSMGNHKERLYKVLNILSADYLFIVEIDLINDTYEALLADYSRINFNIPEAGKYSAANELLSGKIVDFYREKRMELGSIENLKKELKDKDKLVFEFKTDNEKFPWRRALFQKSESDELGNPTKVLLSHIHVDENEMRSQVSIEEFEKEENEAGATRILIAEDYELNAKLAIENAGIAGMVADCAATKEDFISKITKEAGTYKMILMDDKLASENGIDISKEVREMGISVPIILCSLHDSKELDEPCKEAGIEHHVAKPLNAKQLMFLKKKYIE